MRRILPLESNYGFHLLTKQTGVYLTVNHLSHLQTAMHFCSVNAGYTRRGVKNGEFFFMSVRNIVRYQRYFSDGRLHLLILVFFTYCQGKKLRRLQRSFQGTHVLESGWRLFESVRSSNRIHRISWKGTPVNCCLKCFVKKNLFQSGQLTRLGALHREVRRQRAIFM